jgi:hypothetical protein
MLAARWASSSPAPPGCSASSSATWKPAAPARSPPATPWRGRPSRPGRRRPGRRSGSARSAASPPTCTASTRRCRFPARLIRRGNDHAAPVKLAQDLLRRGHGIGRRDAGDLDQDPQPPATRADRSRPAPGPTAAARRASAADHTPASAATPAAASASSSPAVPGSDRFTDAKSGRACGGRTSHPATCCCRAATSPLVIHSLVDTPTGVPGQARRTAATAPATSSASSDSAPPAPRGCRCTASAPAATAPAASRASSAGLTGTAGCSPRCRPPFRHALSRSILPATPQSCHPAQPQPPCSPAGDAEPPDPAPAANRPPSPHARQATGYPR